MFDRQASVGSIMSRHVYHVEPETVMSEVVKILKTQPVHHIPVVDDGRVVGIISASDYHKLEHHFTLFKTQKADEMNAAIFHSLLARDVMTSPVATVRDSDAVQIAADVFKENLFHALPVVDNEKRLVGIITPYDLMIYAYSPQLML